MSLIRSLRWNQLLLLALVVSLVGCDAATRKTMIIDQVIQGANAKKAELLAQNAEVGDINVRRDGEKDGVLFEYTFKDDFLVDPGFNSETARQALVEQFRGNADTAKVLDQDIYVRFVYKTTNGDVKADVTLKKGDL